ncbi:PH domain-containing protein [Pedobacter sp. FW305-3-2-15-E-R2A2]|jgi:membrane protein YdbS with pleckstrin-like domain|uniref:PH domain-containing protein n=1 Tax=Pedobacter sp. FW305-3-2-15-E-R2A2 TaxID=3140251 RepID=UPI0031408139
MQDFTNETINIDVLPKYEEVALNALSRKYWKVVLLNIAIFLFILAAGIAIVLFFVEGFRAYLYVLVGIFLLFSILLITLYRASIKRIGYAIREKDLIYKSGIISISTAIIPFTRIQHITLNEGIFSRMFQLGSLHVFTAGGISGSITIPGLDIHLAKNIKEELNRQLAKVD